MSGTARPAGVVEVVDPGMLSLVEDLGRSGLAELGVGRSGAADQHSFRLANRLVGNTEAAAVVEFVLGGVAFRFHRTATVALTGAPAPARVGGRGAAFNAPFPVHSGEVVRVGRPGRGLRSYLAVRGGLVVDPVLGSRSRDTLAGIGPPPLRAGDRLPLGGDAGSPPVADVAPVHWPSADTPLRVIAGPRADRFDPAALTTLASERYEVGSDSDRVGLRLTGPQLRPSATGAGTGELPSEGMVTGALQVPPSGRPVLFLADHPVTGGYPVIGVVVTADLPRAAQLRPGDPVRFAWTGPA